MIPEVAQTPVEVISTLAALFLGKLGYAKAKTAFLADSEARIAALEARIETLEKISKKVS